MENKALPNEIYQHLPEELKLATSNFTGREKDIVLLSSLVVISGLLPNVYGKYDKKNVYANLYLLIIAPPASGKGVMNFSRGWGQSIHEKIISESRKIIAESKKSSNKKDKSKVTPPFRTKFIPANISNAELYVMIKNAHHGGIMIESEADTLSNMFKQDWGNFSDVLRKAFHHETISISRKFENIYEEIYKPRLSLILSGTPDQILPLVQSKENGLFSRFMYYTFDEIAPWKDVFDESGDNVDHIKNLGKEFMYNLYEKLFKKEDGLKFSLTREQKATFLSEMTKIHEIVNTKGNPYQKSFNSNVKRHGLIMFRLCMILSLIRQHNKISNAEGLICEDTDFYIPMKLIKNLLHHANFILSTIAHGKGLSVRDSSIINSLNETFTRKQAIEAGAKFNVPKRTMDDKLKQWIKIKVIDKIEHGKYFKIGM